MTKILPISLKRKRDSLSDELNKIIRADELSEDDLSRACKVHKDIKLVDELILASGVPKREFPRAVLVGWLALLLVLLGMSLKGPATDVEFDGKSELLEIRFNTKNLTLGRSDLPLEGLKIVEVMNAVNATSSETLEPLTGFNGPTTLNAPNGHTTLTHVSFDEAPILKFYRFGLRQLQVEMNGVSEVGLSANGAVQICAISPTACNDLVLQSGVLLASKDRSITLRLGCVDSSDLCFENENSWAYLGGLAAEIKFHSEIVAPGNPMQIIRGLESAKAIFKGYGGKELQFHRFDDVVIDTPNSNLFVDTKNDVIVTHLVGSAMFGDNTNPKKYHPSFASWIVENPFIALFAVAFSGVIGFFRSIHDLFPRFFFLLSGRKRGRAPTDTQKQKEIKDV